jgi:hypothetical protein
MLERLPLLLHIHAFLHCYFSIDPRADLLILVLPQVAQILPILASLALNLLLHLEGALVEPLVRKVLPTMKVASERRGDCEFEEAE